jgi:hypothetical protein
VSPQASHEGITSVLSSMPSLSFGSEDSRRSGGRDYFVQNMELAQTSVKHFLKQPPVVETTASKTKSPPMKEDLCMNDDSPHPTKPRRSHNDEVVNPAAMDEDSPPPTQVVDLPRMMGTWTRHVFLMNFEGLGWAFGVPRWQYSKPSDIEFYCFVDQSSTKWKKGIEGLFGAYVLGN